MNKYQIFIRCRELPSAHAEYTYTLTARDHRLAINDALKLFRRESHVHRKHIVILEIRATFLCAVEKRQEHTLTLFGVGTKGE